MWIAIDPPFRGMGVGSEQGRNSSGREVPFKITIEHVRLLLTESTHFHAAGGGGGGGGVEATHQRQDADQVGETRRPVFSQADAHRGLGADGHRVTISDARKGTKMDGFRGRTKAP